MYQAILRKNIFLLSGAYIATKVYGAADFGKNLRTWDGCGVNYLDTSSCAKTQPDLRNYRYFRHLNVKAGMPTRDSVSIFGLSH